MRSSSTGKLLAKTAGVVAILLAWHAWPAAGGMGPVAAAAQDAVVSGRLAAIWEDPMPGQGTPRLRHFLSADDGRLVPLRASDAQLRTIGGPLQANGRYVEVTGRWTGRRSASGATADRELEVRGLRLAAAPSGAGATPAASGAPIFGSHPWITVLCRFADSPTTEPHPLSWYVTLMGSAEPGMDHYWRELSFDQANVSGSQALGWYDLPEDHAAYVDGDNADLGKLRDDCAAAADADVHFPDYVGINFQFNEPLGSFSWGGGSTLVIDGVSKFYRMTWMASWATHVTYAHEMGHGFGLPHSSGPYGAVYDSNWDVMSGAWTVSDPTWGWLSPHTISYHKNMLAWIPSGRIYDAYAGSDQTITLHRLADLGSGGDYLMARVYRHDGTYYTVETRRDLGYDANLPAEAVIMHHVTDRAYVVDPDNDGNPDNAGARWLPGETFEDPDNGIAITIESQTPEGYVVTIVVADAGHMVLTPGSLGFAADQGTDPAPGVVTLENTGSGELQWSASSDQPWLSVAPASGAISAAGSTDLTLSVSTTGLTSGQHAATVTVTGNADNSPQTVAVTVDVTAAPVIAIDTEDMEIEAIIGQGPGPQDLVIRNAGESDLTWTATSDAAWLSLQNGSGNLSGGAQFTERALIAMDGLSVGEYSGTITVSGNATNSPQVLNVALTVTLWPSLAVDATELRDEVWEGDAAMLDPLTVTNDGDGTLAWDVSDDGEWLTMTPSSGSLPAGESETIELTVATPELDPGTHTATITVSGIADDAPQTVSVEVVVNEQPSLTAQDVADHLLGVRSPLDGDELGYLDDIGNQNGGFDAGDFRAWLMRMGMMSRTGPVGEEVTP